MSRTTRWVVLGGAWVLSQLALPAVPVQAGPFIDWLLGRPIYTYPAPAAPVVTAYPQAGIAAAPPVAAAYGTVAAPVTAGYAAPAYAPVTTYYQGVAPAVAAPAGVLPAASYPMPMYTSPNYAVAPAQPAAVAYVPSYRTTWFRAPVTYYRPVTSYQGIGAYQPVTTLPVTAMQPCNSYTWRAQRVPTLFRRPWLPAPAPVTYAPAYVPPVAEPAWSAPSAPAYPAAPLEQPPAVPYSVPGAVVPSTTVPATPYAPGNGLPSGAGTVPADQPPVLTPGSVPGGALPNSAMHAPSPLAPSSTTAARVPQAPASSVYQVKPIPVPELKDPPSSPRPTAPPLLNARERTASADVSHGSTAVTPAVWSAERRSTPSRPDSPAATSRPLWNDHGWTSSRGGTR